MKKIVKISDMIEEEKDFTFKYIDSIGIMRHGRTDINVLNVNSISDKVRCTLEFISLHKTTKLFKPVIFDEDIAKAILSSVSCEGMCPEIAQLISEFATEYYFDNITYSTKKQLPENIYLGINLILIHYSEFNHWLRFSDYMNMKVLLFSEWKSIDLNSELIEKWKKYDALIMTIPIYNTIYKAKLKARYPSVIDNILYGDHTYTPTQNKFIVWERLFISETNKFCNQIYRTPLALSKRKWILTADQGNSLKRERSSFPWRSSYNNLNRVIDSYPTCPKYKGFNVFHHRVIFEDIFEKKGIKNTDCMAEAIEYVNTDTFNLFCNRKRQSQSFNKWIKNIFGTSFNIIRHKFMHVLSYIKKNETKNVLIVCNYHNTIDELANCFEKEGIQVSRSFLYRTTLTPPEERRVFIYEPECIDFVSECRIICKRDELSTIDQVFILSTLSPHAFKNIFNALILNRKKKDLWFNFLCYNSQVKMTNNLLLKFDYGRFFD